ncbi:hypothetical protein C0Q70_15215 [Pomacea canaliculata]|uniref:Uncharacterized protein n=1 Tax=Pomacea canaliculata TaxID=400727 RepID=A0A2T7NU73_POMCA|nr:hypothetical protein C0Q70_15215 [Pomacea canaliculata]
MSNPVINVLGVLLNLPTLPRGKKFASASPPDKNQLPYHPAERRPPVMENVQPTDP